MVQTNTHGIFQSDVLIRSALLWALEDLRENPWLLDYCFAFFPNDDLTQATYGQKELQAIKDWFLKTDINIFMAGQPQDPKFPCYTIALQESAEDKNTLGDVHHDISEQVDPREIAATPIVTLGPFTPTSYDPATGIVTVPSTESVVDVYPDYRLFDATSGRAYAISDVDNDTNTFTIPLNVTANLTRCYVAPASSLYIVSLESAIFKETYRIGCHALGEQKYALILDTVLRFILLRYKEDLLEARGFEVSRVSSTDLNENPYVSESLKQVCYSRYTSINGLVRNYWPKKVGQALSVVTGGEPCDTTSISPGFILLCTSLSEGWAAGPNETFTDPAPDFDDEDPF